MSQPTQDNPKAPKRSSRRKPAMEPLGWDEIVSQPGMGGYLSFLNGPIPLPHLQPPAPEALADPVVVSDPEPVSTPAVAAALGVVSTRERVLDPATATTPAITLTSVVMSGPVVELNPEPRITSEKSPAPEANRDPGVLPVPDGFSGPAIPPGSGNYTTTGRRPRIRKCAAAHEGHSLGEEVLYQALWKAATPESAAARTIVIGWRGMSQLCRMTPKNCKINTQRLIRKLALEVLSPYNTPESIGTTYRIFPSEAILSRRQAAGLEWVVRSRGVEFVDPATGIPCSAHLCGYALDEAAPL